MSALRVHFLPSRAKCPRARFAPGVSVLARLSGGLAPTSSSAEMNASPVVLVGLLGQLVDVCIMVHVNMIKIREGRHA